MPEDNPNPFDDITFPRPGSWGDAEGDGPLRPSDDQEIDPFDRVNDWTWETMDVWDYGYDTEAEYDDPAARARRRRIFGPAAGD